MVNSTCAAPSVKITKVKLFFLDISLSKKKKKKKKLLYCHVSNKNKILVVVSPERSESIFCLFVHVISVLFI